MATAAITPGLFLSGPGILYAAPLSTALPSQTVTASAFSTSAFGGSWVAIGSTEAGSNFSYSISTDNMEAAESYDPVRIVTTGRDGSWSVALNEINKSNLKLALNGPTPVVTGATTTTLTQIGPPALGSEVRTMIGWQSEDNTVRFFGYQCLQVGNLDLTFNKGADNASLSLEFRFELPSSGNAWDIFLAGATRGA